eukprot:CAMPEP_0114549370 /NCGR_PEP_ID=MMETSP0114-20121206/5492_1 /TAXON_ID=31324 /ORGANISM="Goniomonas sp, Strain m" /LENGTH=269 /DNA_ID=CAMNT_0001734049 /DNA_START=18 /DNA_END=828 /DNA_ORIENTATION=+
MVVDYSKFDKIVDSDDEDEKQPSAAAPSQPPVVPAPSQSAAPYPKGLPPGGVPFADLDEKTQQEILAQNPELAKAAGVQAIKPTPTNSKDKKRKQFKHGDQVVYEWDQSLDEVNIYITMPPGCLAKHLTVDIKAQHLKIGITGNPPYLNESLFSKVKTQESFWTVEDGELHITLCKMNKAESWDAALMGHGQLDTLTQEEVRKDILLERFQEENPGFDFSGATFNGAVPDARSFMGGGGTTESLASDPRACFELASLGHAQEEESAPLV